jgi:hypothetical protein
VYSLVRNRIHLSNNHDFVAVSKYPEQKKLGIQTLFLATITKSDRRCSFGDGFQLAAQEGNQTSRWTVSTAKENASTTPKEIAVDVTRVPPKQSCRKTIGSK